MILDILKYPDKRLRKQCTSVENFGAEFQTLIENMFETMYVAPGIGLAAIQVGTFQRFLVMDIGIPEGQVIKRNPMVLVNPEIISKEGEIVWEEGCLSCPDLVVPVTRSKKIEIHSLDRHGKEQNLTAEDLTAVCIQHEIDHLDGILIVDKMSRLKQDLYKQQLNRATDRPIVR
jgi:peptide deformylase